MVATGRRLLPNPDLPSFSDSPWNTVTTQVSAGLTGTGASSTAAINAAQVVQALSQQLSGTTTMNLEIRFRSTRIYGGAPVNQAGESGDPTQFYLPFVGIYAEVFSLDYGATSLSSQPLMASLNDSVGAKEYAAVGYVWPMTQQSNTFNNGSTSQPIVTIGANFTTLGTSTLSVVARFELFWRVRYTPSTGVSRRFTILPVTAPSFTLPKLSGDLSHGVDTTDSGTRMGVGHGPFSQKFLHK